MMADEIKTLSDCLKGFIGVKGCGSVTANDESGSTEPGSGLYINGLPGITLKSMQKISNSEQGSYKGMMAEVELRALRKLATACMAKLNECYKITDPIIIACLVCENKNLFATALWYLEGVELMVETLYSDRFNWYTMMNEDQATELKDYFQVEFEKELQNACAGINPDDSDCIETVVQTTGVLRFVEAKM